MYLDLSELHTVMNLSPWWSLERFNLASFRRRDYWGDEKVSLDESIRSLVENETGVRPQGRICLLTNLRYFGYLINPISCYYCFDSHGKLTTVVAEVTNTPWRERHAYVLPVSAENGELVTRFSKELHVSPFMPMNMEYLWESNVPQKDLGIYMENLQQGVKQFCASLQLERVEISAQALNRIIRNYPFMTMKVVWGIYRQALGLWLKRIPFFTHPAKKPHRQSLSALPAAVEESGFENHHN
jgi:DUF1365 family protein